MMDQSNHFISHYGVLGMRWGVRRNGPTSTGIRNQLGIKRDRVGLTNERTTSMLKEDLAGLKDGSRRSSTGITKARQEAYDKRDIKRLEMKISDLEEDKVKRGKTIVSALLHDLAR